MNKAHWEKFEEKYKEKLKHKEPNYDSIEYFIKILNSIAKDCIPKTATPNKQSRPWFNDWCQETIKLQKVALKNF